jgi:hypothetical protein
LKIGNQIEEVSNNWSNAVYVVDIQFEGPDE